MQRKQENSVTDSVSVGKNWWKPTVRDVNPYIVCGLCDGYLVDATTVTKCLHSYCRSCLLSYIRNTKYKNCPSCRDQFKISLITNYRRDWLLQRLVYKMVPGLYRAVVRRKLLFRDTSDIQRAVPLDKNKNCLSRRHQHERIRKSFDLYTGDEQINVCLLHWDSFDDNPTQSEQLFISGDTCYLQCPTGLTISHLKKYLRLKFGIEDGFEIDLFVGKGCVPDTFTLVDVAYCFFAKRVPEITLSYVVVTDGRKAIGPRQTKYPALTTPPPPRLCSTSLLQQPQQLNSRRTSRATSLTSTTTAAATTVRETPRRDPTARLRKRMINNNFERRRRRPTTTTTTTTTTNTTTAAAVTASPPIPLTDHQYLRKLIDDYGDVEIEITEIVNDVDTDVEPSDHQLPADVIQADGSLADDCEPLLIDDDDVDDDDERLPMVDTRLPNMCIETERDDGTLSAILDDNLNDVMAAALGTLVTDSACVLSVSELEVDNSASSDQWIEARAKSGTVCRQIGEGISDQLIVELVSTAGSRDDADETALSDASSDIDGEIRKIAANVTCNSNNDDDINSVSDEDERRCGIPAMSSPYPENSLEPTVGVDDLSSSPPPTVLTDDHDVVVTSAARVCNIISDESSKGLGLENINCEMRTGDSSSSVVRELTICGDSPGSGAVAVEQSIGILARGSSSSLSFEAVSQSDTGNSGNIASRQDHSEQTVIEVGADEHDRCGELSSSSSDSCHPTIVENQQCNLDNGKLCSDNGEKSRFSPEAAKQLAMDCVRSLQGNVVDRKASLVVPLNSSCVSRLTVKTSVDCGVPSPPASRLNTPPGAKNGQLVADDVIINKQGQPCTTSVGSRRSSRSDSSSGYSSGQSSSSSSMDALSPGSAASDSLSPVSGFQQLITTCVTTTTTSAPVSHGQSIMERNSIGTQTNTDLLGRYFKRQNKPVNSFLPPGSATKYTRASTVQTIGSPCRRDSTNLGFKDRILRTTGGLKTVQSSSSSSLPPSMFIRAHSNSAFKTSASSLSLDSSSNLNGSSVGTTAVLLTSGQQGSAGSILLPVPSVSPINNNNSKGTFLIALPVNFSISSSISGGIVCPTISVPPLGGISKVVPAAGSGVLQTGSSLTVCPLIVKALPSTTANRPAVSGSVQLNNRSTVAPYRMSVSVANSSATNDMHCLKTSVAAAAAAAAAGNTNSSGCRTTTVILAAAAKCSSQPPKLQSSVAILPSTVSAATPLSSNQVARTYSCLSGQVVVAATGDNRQVTSLAGNNSPTSRNDAASEPQSSVTGCSSSLRSVLSGSGRSSSIQGTPSNRQIQCNVQGQGQQGPARDAISARQHQQQLPNGNSCWSSSQSIGSKATCIVVVTGQPSAVVGQTGAVTVSSSSSSLSQAAVARHSAMAGLPQLSLTASRKTLPVACSSSAFSSFCPVGASLTSSSVSANTNGDLKAPEVTVPACSYIRKILESDLVGVSNGDVSEKLEDEGRRVSDVSTTAVGLKGHLAVQPMPTNQASTSLALLCSTKTGRRSTLQQQSSTQPLAPSTALKRPSIDSSHVTAVTKRSRPMQQLSTDSSTTSTELGSVLNGLEPADGSQLERVAMATICSEAQQTTNVTNNSSNIGPSGGPSESWIQARTTRSGSGMVALPKKVYTYLGSAMSHEHIAASQLVRGSPSPSSNSSSLDGSDVCGGLVPSSTSPTTIACSPAAARRLSNESLLAPSTDDGPIRQLRLMCKHVA